MTNKINIPDEAVQAKRNLIQSYDWSFKSTGVDAIDDILASIADAAESYHNTSQWKDTGHIDRNIKAIRKSDRQRDKANGAIRPKSALSGRKRPRPALRKTLPPRPMFVPVAPTTEAGK